MKFTIIQDNKTNDVNKEYVNSEVIKSLYESVISGSNTENQISGYIYTPYVYRKWITALVGDTDNMPATGGGISKP